VCLYFHEGLKLNCHFILTGSCMGNLDANHLFCKVIGISFKRYGSYSSRIPPRISERTSQDHQRPLHNFAVGTKQRERILIEAGLLLA
jgi:hypothetical protein